ncbi:XXYS1_4_G0014760.mRNA.1.CDS.1 [Saccharomyces cerevisiae]|nr:XXYS1_4_G0014760.mRNA.1.CDS.1 [Saccharomyces cerevisiae]
MVTYAGKLVLAPMVRAGELPTRLMALAHGADLVWSPEIIDKKLIQCIRKENTALQTVDYVVPSKVQKRPETLVFRTYPKLESSKLIFQIGSASPALATQAALKVINDVSGIDINAGCPKHFSVHSGMGSALLRTPDTLCLILKELVKNVGNPHSKPISVKIRLLDTKQDTLQLVKRLCATGITNLTVHCRKTEMRNREQPITDYIAEIYEICQANNVSLIVNGAIRDRSHFHDLQANHWKNTNIGGMIAECAERDPTVFEHTSKASEDGPSWVVACREFIQWATKFDNHIGNTKYMLSRIVPGKSVFFQYFARCKSPEEVSFVLKQLNDDGSAQTDPSEYLENCRAQEKALKNANAIAKQKRKQTDHIGSDTKKQKVVPLPTDI